MKFKLTSSKLLLCSLLLLSVCFFTSCKDKQEVDLYTQIIKRDKLIIGVKDDARPFGFLDSDGKLKGFDIDLSKYIAKSLLLDENKIEFVPVTASNRIMMLNSDRVDMIIATMSITPKRQEVVDFSHPYYVAGQTFLVPIKSNIKSATDLRDKRIIVVFGSTAEKNVRTILPEANFLGFKTYKGALSALKSGRADAMSADDTLLLGILENNKEFKILSKRYTKEPYAIALKKSEETKILKNKLNGIIEYLCSEGELDKLKRKWIKK